MSNQSRGGEVEVGVRYNTRRNLSFRAQPAFGGLSPRKKRACGDCVLQAEHDRTVSTAGGIPQGGDESARRQASQPPFLSFLV